MSNNNKLFKFKNRWKHRKNKISAKENLFKNINIFDRVFVLQ